MPHLGFNSLPTPSHIARWELLNLQFLPGVCAPLCVVLWRYTPRVDDYQSPPTVIFLFRNICMLTWQYSIIDMRKM